MMYICEICEAWKDDDYSPAEFIAIVHESADKAGKRGHKNDECPVCEDCFLEHSKEGENE